MNTTIHTKPISLRCNKCQDRPGKDGLGRPCKTCNGTGWLHGPGLSARWCPLCGTQHAVTKGEPSPWPNVSRTQIEILAGMADPAAEIAALREALEVMLCADNAICQNIGRKSDQAMQRIAAIDNARAALANTSSNHA